MFMIFQNILNQNLYLVKHFSFDFSNKFHFITNLSETFPEGIYGTTLKQFQNHCISGNISVKYLDIIESIQTHNHNSRIFKTSGN